MPPASQATYRSGQRPEVPPIGNPDLWASGVGQDTGHASKLRLFLDSFFVYETLKRCELERGWNRARLYDANHQWIRPYMSAGGRLWFTWEPIRFRKGDAKFPMPKRNIFSPAIQDETARLVGVGSKPYVRVDDPDAEDGAQAARQALQGRNEETGWDDQNRRGCYHAPMFGQWIQESGWRIDLTKKVRRAPTGAVRCATCSLPDPVTGATGPGFTLKSPALDTLEAQHLKDQNPASVADLVDKSGQPSGYQARACPNCGGPLEAYEPPESEIKGGADALGRPMYEEQPEGEDFNEARSPYSFFPENQGVGYECDEDMMEWGFREPMSLTVLRKRYRNGHLVTANRSMEAYRHHPVVSTWGLAYSAERLWMNHNLLDRYYLRPCPEFPRGRAIEMAGNVVLFDGELLIPGTDIPRSEVHVAQWELREGEIWGKSLSEDLFSTQDSINSAMAQFSDVVQKWVSPKLILHEGQNLQQAGALGNAYGGDVWTINNRGLPPELAAKFPHVFANQGNPGTLWQMYDRDRDHVKDASGARDAEIGNVGGSELNYSALVFQAQQSATRRKPRVDGLRRLKRRAWKHRLRLIAGLWTEERLVRYRDDSDKWAVRRLRGMQLMGQTDVELEDEPLVEKGIAERASIQQGLEWGVIRTSGQGGSYGSDRRIARAIGIPEKLNEDRNLQEDDAIHEWKVHLEGEEEPVIDQQSDNDQIHYNTHTVSLGGREAQQLKEQCAAAGIRWSSVLKATWEWEKLLGELRGMAQAVRTAPPANQMLLLMGPEQAMATMDKLRRAREVLTGFPAVLELQIHNVWTRLIEAHGFPESQWPEALRVLVRFKAHALGHWMRALQHPLLATDMAMPPAAAQAAAPGPGGGAAAPSPGAPAGPGGGAPAPDTSAGMAA